ncbi:uncharacterized protein BXZ73DRAFT_57308, partial [Epithele typhae]|uniref:uncharacterized protein n=1 Tax=Epithele typhae TaxID=378194 RepID=UPI0020084C78
MEYWEDVLNPGIEDRLYESLRQEISDIQDRLTKSDFAILRAYTYKLKHNLTESALEDLPYVLQSSELPTLHKIRARIAFLSGITPHRYDCCLDSCMAFVGPSGEEVKCLYCGLSRYDEDKRPRKQWTYLALEPRLAALYRHRPTAVKMLYRGDYQSKQGVIADLFDSKHYRTLKNHNVFVHGKDSGRKFFSDRRDIALGISTDGFAPWRRRKKT